jgi:chromosome partitioning protein
MVVVNRVKAGTRVLDEVAAAVAAMDVLQAQTTLGNRVAYAETLGQGKGVLEAGRGAWTAEVEGLASEILAAFDA